MWKMCALSKEMATWCVRWRQHTPSCELSLEVLICWVLAAQRSSVDWTGYSSASRGWASLGTSSVDLCSCAVCTNQSHCPATVKHRTSQSVLRHKLTCMLSMLKFFKKLGLNLFIFCPDFRYSVHIHISDTVVEATNTEIRTRKTIS